MVTKEPKSFHEAIKPLINFNCIVGIGAFRHPNQSHDSFCRMRIHVAIVTIVNWINTYIGISSLSDALDFEEATPMALKMYKVLVCTNSGIALSAPFLVWHRRKGLRDCFRMIPSLSETFETVLGARNEYRKTYKALTYQIGGILIVMILVGILDMVWSLEMKVEMNLRSVLTFTCISMTLHHPILIMLVLDVNFCTFLRYLGKNFRDLNDGLMELAEKPKSTSSAGDRLFVISRNVVKITPTNKANDRKFGSLINDENYTLHEIRKAYLDLCKLSQKINAVFGIQNLLSMAISFVMITGLLYTMYSAFSGQFFTYCSLKEIVPSFTWTAIYALKIWMVNHFCWSVSNEAQRTGEVIYELLRPTVDRNFQKEIQEFGVQILQNPVRFNACGFFTLDYTFVQGVIGSITTYLVILIQMGNASGLTASESLINGTKI